MAQVGSSKHLVDEDYKRSLIGRTLVPYYDGPDSAEQTPDAAGLTSQKVVARKFNAAGYFEEEQPVFATGHGPADGADAAAAVAHYKSPLPKVTRAGLPKSSTSGSSAKMASGAFAWSAFQSAPSAEALPLPVPDMIFGADGPEFEAEAAAGDDSWVGFGDGLQVTRGRGLGVGRSPAIVSVSASRRAGAASPDGSADECADSHLRALFARAAVDAAASPADGGAAQGAQLLSMLRGASSGPVSAGSVSVGSVGARVGVGTPPLQPQSVASVLTPQQQQQGGFFSAPSSVPSPATYPSSNQPAVIAQLPFLGPPALAQYPQTIPAQNTFLGSAYYSGAPLAPNPYAYTGGSVAPSSPMQHLQRGMAPDAPLPTSTASPYAVTAPSAQPLPLSPVAPPPLLRPSAVASALASPPSAPSAAARDCQAWPVLGAAATKPTAVIPCSPGSSAAASTAGSDAGSATSGALTAAGSSPAAAHAKQRPAMMLAPSQTVRKQLSGSSAGKA